MSTVQIPDMLTTSNKKEKVNMILEPLQVMLTLAMLSFCPVGTKIYIINNVLYVHEPSMLQGVYRWLDGNSKDDLYYLFHAIRRYYKWYKTIDSKVYELILKLAKEGIKKLISTYQKAMRAMRQIRQTDIQKVPQLQPTLDPAPSFLVQGPCSSDSKTAPSSAAR